MTKLSPRANAVQRPVRGARMTGPALALACGAAVGVWTLPALAQSVPPTPAEAKEKPAAEPAESKAEDKAKPEAAEGAEGSEPPAPTEPAPVAVKPVLSDKPEWPISKLVFQFAPAHPKLPPMDEILAAATLTLAHTSDENPENEGFVVSVADFPEAAGTVSVLQINEHLAEHGRTKFSLAAIFAIQEAVAKEMEKRNLIGVYVPTGETFKVSVFPNGRVEVEDLRDPSDDDVMNFAVQVPFVKGLKTVAAGGRLGPDEQRINNDRHKRIFEASPVQPYSTGPDGEEGPRNDLLLRNEIDDFVFRLNRYPGRRVDVALSNFEDQYGAVELDYLIRESQPWTLYFQVSNTGTEQTNEWRERVGFIHNQLTDNDDALQLDYVTGGFEQTHIFNASYARPLTTDGKLRAKIAGGYSEFNASEVGQSNENFTGSSYQFGGELSYNVFQWRELFVDVYGGGRFQNVEVTNNTLGVALTGETDFALLGGGVRMERTTDVATTTIDLGFDVNASGIAGTDPAELTRLGRLGTQKDFTIFRFAAEQSFYLEPIFDSEAFKRQESTLAHEIVLAVRGQMTDDRVAPSFQGVAGGLYSVRGYDESAAAGDTVVIASAEYRLHIPRLLAPNENQKNNGIFGEDFRWAPQQPYGRPDWDLIFRAFVDAATTKNSDRLTFERDEDLLSAGVGIELVYKRNLNLRLDWGSVMSEVGTGRGANEEGDHRFHFVATLLF